MATTVYNMVKHCIKWPWANKEKSSEQLELPRDEITDLGLGLVWKSVHKAQQMTLG